MRIRILPIIGLILLLASCTSSQQDTIRIQDAWARPTHQSGMNMSSESGHSSHSNTDQNPMKGSTSAIYMIIYNDSRSDDRLIGARSAIAEVVEIHETRVENDIMRMQQVDGIDLPARSQVELKPGGYHIMLINPKQDLKVGDKVPFTLVFEKHGEISLEAEVRMP